VSVKRAAQTSDFDGGGAAIETAHPQTSLGSTDAVTGNDQRLEAVQLLVDPDVRLSKLAGCGSRRGGSLIGTTWTGRLVRAWCARGLKPTRNDSKGSTTKGLLRARMRGWAPVILVAGIDLSRR
jgi:hypothetical protein